MIELLTTSQMAAADRLAIASGVASLALMETAGRAVAAAALDLAPHASPILIICGPGNNGGDGFVAARALAERGVPVEVTLLGDPDGVKGDAQEMLRRWGGEIRPTTPDAVAGCGLIIDAMFGAGLSRPPSGLAADVIAAANGSGVPIVAVDVPSGLDGSSGAAAGPVIQATRTVTFFRKKPGHLLMPGRALCGDVIVADIGIPASVLDDMQPKTFENAPQLWRAQYRWPRLDDHKYARGHVVVASGPADQTGAARLGARAALRVGAGLVTLVGDRAATAVNAMHSTGVMVREAAGARGLIEFFADERRNVALIGPGATSSPDTADAVLAILTSGPAAVIDADGLTAFAAPDEQASRGRFGFLGSDVRGSADASALFSAIKGRAASVVMTPHEGEFRRLFGAVPGDKLVCARQAASISGATLILKGADTVIASPDGRAAINANAPPWLATAGSGDVLAGLVAGLIAQGMPAFEAACAAVWLHGETAERLGLGLIAEDLSEALPATLRALYAERDC